MKRILLLMSAVCIFLGLAAYGVAQDHPSDHPTKETSVKKYPKKKKILNLGEPTPQERAAAQRHEQNVSVEDSGEYMTGEDMADDTTAEQREFGE